MVAAAIPAAGEAQAAPAPVAHPVVFFEIGCKDRAKTNQFFTDLFGWKMQENSPLSSAIDMAGQGGVPGQIVALGHEPQHYTMFYVEVEDVKAYLDKAVALGGKILVPPIQIPTGTFAWFSDLDGNMIGLLKKK
jgi:predicted enzyme related to lactoylglutathione lyase